MLVNCVTYQHGEKLSDIPVGEIRANLDRPDCFVWVALKNAEASELSALQAEFGLHELAIEDAQKGHQRPKMDEYGSSLFIVMHPSNNKERSCRPAKWRCSSVRST